MYIAIFPIPTYEKYGKLVVGSHIQTSADRLSSAVCDRILTDEATTDIVIKIVDRDSIMVSVSGGEQQIYTQVMSVFQKQAIRAIYNVKSRDDLEV